MKKRTPAERERIETLRADRIALSKNRCEFCGDKAKLQAHHICDKDSKRRANSEQWVESIRMLCVGCHLYERKHIVIPALRKEFELFLRGIGKTDDEIRTITGRKIHI